MQDDHHQDGVRTRTSSRGTSRAIAIALPSEYVSRPYLHPAVITDSKQMIGTLLRVLVIFAGIVAIALLVSGCSVVEHRDGGGYTVRYASLTDPVPSPPPSPQPRRYAKAKVAAPAEVIVIRERAESHPVLNIGKDDEIPREYANYVSDRGVKTWRQRRKMCAEARPAYCSAPNVAHCHGPFCHAHVGGDKRHTH